MAKSIVNLAKVKSQRTGHVLHVISADELENGFIVFAGDNVEGESELRDATKPTTDAIATDSAYLVYNDEILYDESTYAKKQLGQFSIPAGIPARAYELAKEDEFEVSYDGLTLLADDAVVGNVLVVANGSYKLKELATPAGTEKFVAKIIAVKTVGTMAYVGSNGQVGNQYKMAVARVEKN